MIGLLIVRKLLLLLKNKFSVVDHLVVRHFIQTEVLHRACIYVPAVISSSCMGITLPLDYEILLV